MGESKKLIEKTGMLRLLPITLTSMREATRPSNRPVPSRTERRPQPPAITTSMCKHTLDVVLGAINMAGDAPGTRRIADVFLSVEMALTYRMHSGLHGRMGHKMTCQSIALHSSWG